MKKGTIARGMILIAIAALVFMTGLYFGRTGGGGAFTVATQYEIGAVSPLEIEELAAIVERREAREQGQTETQPEPPPTVRRKKT